MSSDVSHWQSPTVLAGIGKALALRMADQGINVVLVAKPDNLLDETYAEMQGIYKHLQIRKASTMLYNKESTHSQSFMTMMYVSTGCC